MSCSEGARERAGLSLACEHEQWESTWVGANGQWDTFAHGQWESTWLGAHSGMQGMCRRGRGSAQRVCGWTGILNSALMLAEADGDVCGQHKSCKHKMQARVTYANTRCRHRHKMCRNTPSFAVGRPQAVRRAAAQPLPQTWQGPANGKGLPALVFKTQLL